jgi:hypothetical protein
MSGLYAKRFHTPLLVKLLFPLGALGLMIMTGYALSSGMPILITAGLFVLSVLVLYVLSEVVLVLFRIHSTLEGIDDYFHSYEKVIDQKFQMLDARIQQLNETQ